LVRFATVLYMDTKEIIKKSGLDETETSVYSALLELGPSTVTEITKRAGITRTLGYSVLQKLGWQGLINQASGHGKKKIFSAEHPNRLKQLIKNKQNQWERNLKDIEESLPELVNIYKVAEKPTIRFQQGAEGLKNIYNETLESKSEILSILDIAGWEQAEYQQFARNYNKERSQRKIMERVLILDNEGGRKWFANYQGSLKYTNNRWIKPEQLPGISDFGGELNVYENKVVMALFKNAPMGVLIESKVLANILRALFEMAWLSGIPIKDKK